MKPGVTMWLLKAGGQVHVQPFELSVVCRGSLSAPKPMKIINIRVLFVCNTRVPYYFGDLNKDPDLES